MRDEPSVARVDKTMQFHSFLYELPILHNERRRTSLLRIEPVASVGWSHDQSWARPTRSSEPEPVGERYRVHYIIPFAVVPVGMRHVLARVFLGR